MAPETVARASSIDLWALAAARLSDDDKRNINFSLPDKLDVLADLHKLAETSKQECIKKRWRYTRKSGEVIIFRDLFDKIIHWIDLFGKVGDVTVSYDPMHAALPWAGVRFILQIAVNDSAKFAFLVEGVASVAELICRYAVVENLYIQSTSAAGGELERTLVHLYAAIMIYLSKAKGYFDQNSASQYKYGQLLDTTKVQQPERILKSGFLAESDFGSYLGSIRTAQEEVSRCTALVDRDDQVHNYSELKSLLEQINAPMSRMDHDLKSVRDHLEVSKRTDILRWISPEPYIQHHDQIRKDVLPGTGRWLLAAPVFKIWKDDSVSSLLWLHGMIGSGKSKLASIVIEEAMRTFQTGENPPPVFFYCSRNVAEPARSNPDAILASLARQLSNLQPADSLLSPVIETYRKNEAQGFASGPLRIDQSRALIIELVEHYPLTLIVIDALDECDPDHRIDLLDALETIVRESSSLVKIFLSCRDDQDIVCHLRNYPDLEISSDKNSEDIAHFVKVKTGELVQKRKLLRHSQAREDMIELIVKKVIEGANGMFRWASLQLQNLCSFTLDADIRERLGVLPPTLENLYFEIYENLLEGPGTFGIGVLRNVLTWLLCAKRTLKTAEFLTAVSILPGKDFQRTTKNQVLELCNNLVVFDAQLDMFRFAHLSVREFLEKRPEYNITATNCLAAEICLLTLISRAQTPATKSALSDSDWHLIMDLLDSKEFLEYANIYWATHCQLAADARTHGKLKSICQFFLADSVDPKSAFAVWTEQFSDLGAALTRFYVFDLWSSLSKANTASAQAAFVAASFDFSEILEHKNWRIIRTTMLADSHAEILKVCAEHGSCNFIKLLLEQEGANVQIAEEVVVAASENQNSGMEVMAILLDQRGSNIQITEEVVAAAARNPNTEVMTLLLDRLGEIIHITEDIVIAAVGNGSTGVIKLLFDRRAEDIQINEKMVMAAAENEDSGAEVMTILLDRCGEDIQITKEVVTAAVKNEDSGAEIMTLLLDRRGEDIQITENVVTAAARNGSTGVIKLLFDRRGEDVQITERLVTAAAENARRGAEVMTLLLDRRGEDVQITERVVTAAARNKASSAEVMTVLLDRRGKDIQITESVVTAAARNKFSGIRVMTLLLDRRGEDIQITERVVTAAARNEYNGTRVMTLLLNRRGEDIQITENVVTAAVGNTNTRVIKLLFDRRGEDIQITERVVTAAVRNFHNGAEMMTLLLDRRGEDIQITEEVVLAAAGNDSTGAEVMTLLLDRRGKMSRSQKGWLQQQQEISIVVQR